MISQVVLERLAIAISMVVIIAAGWFWSGQIGDVIETLALAYG